MAARTGPQSEANYKHKVVLCGQFGVGKTSVMRRFVNDSFVDKSKVQSGIGSPPAENGRYLSVEVWDTAGLERFRSLSSSYYTGAAAALVCYAVDDRCSFQAAAEYVVEALDVFGRSSSGAGAVVFLCGNKTDVADQGTVSTAMSDSLADEYDHIVARSYRVSCRTGDGVTSMFQDIATELDKRALDKADRAATLVISPAGSPISRGAMDTICSC